MSRGVLRTYDLCPDGVRIVVEWSAMAVCTSIFVPCINTAKAIAEAKTITAGKGWDIEVQVGVVGDKWGVCIWRVL